MDDHVTATGGGPDQTLGGSRGCRKLQIMTMAPDQVHREKRCLPDNAQDNGDFSREDDGRS
ncbi:hypothetical protein IB277_21190 [Ensifer sp. ENS07]|uniref:hypothetical protein n=1 Tax=Ensifer sp. ENS07 TaxID=2769274 RepID=UPI001785A8BA|nr:hypothetical protein [Ensifer sp. ENS07]MBD9638807.1 hypothetical protein [Ensifer sp. ENS07]